MVHIRPDDPRLDSPDPKVWGPLAWEELDEWTDAYLHCKSCNESFRNYTQAYRDAIAIENGQIPHNSQNLLEVYGKLGQFVEKCHKAGHCSPARKFLPHGLTECEKTHPSVQKKLSRCIRKLEPREQAGEIRSAVAVCRASVKCPST